MDESKLTFSVSANKISSKPGYNVVFVRFSSNVPYRTFECRATKEGDSYGPGIGKLIAAFSYTPAQIERAFEIYDEYLTAGDGNYRISLYAETEDGNIFIPSGFTMLITSDGEIFITA